MSRTILDKSSQSKTDQDSIAQLRRDYLREELNEERVEEHPIDQFMIWFEQALSADLLDANAMILSTATKEGIPSSRVVLLKGVDKEGFRFYTNYNSRKGRELSVNPQAAVCFYWSALERQVRIEGSVKKMGQEQSRAYFKQRPRMSQIGAWVSRQSAQVSSREVLEKQFREIEKKFKGGEVPLPDFWGGFVLQPQQIEFWQGRKGRMHDRICYKGAGENWEIVRLSP